MLSCRNCIRSAASQQSKWSSNLSSCNLSQKQLYVYFQPHHGSLSECDMLQIASINAYIKPHVTRWICFMFTYRERVKRCADWSTWKSFYLIPESFSFRIFLFVSLMRAILLPNTDLNDFINLRTTVTSYQSYSNVHIADLVFSVSHQPTKRIFLCISFH